MSHQHSSDTGENSTCVAPDDVQIEDGSPVVQAHSSQTGKTYESWEAPMNAEANGHVVVSILQRVHPKTRKTTVFARTTGPFAEKQAAQRKAATLRRHWKRALVRAPEGTSLIGVRVEPLWIDLMIDQHHD